MNINPLNALLPEPPPSNPTEFRWGTVTSVSPVRVNLDRDDAAIEITCNTLIHVRENMRVMVMRFEGRSTVIGAGQGRDSGGHWQPWTPRLVAGTDPSGSGITAVGQYLEIGAMTHFDLQMNFTSGWDRGVGVYSITLPTVPDGYSPSTLRSMLHGEFAVGPDQYPANATVEDGGTALISRVRYLGAGATWNTFSANSTMPEGRLSLSGSYRSGSL